VFLSYASQDAQAAQGICEALRAAGIEVWFDQSELRGARLTPHGRRRDLGGCGLSRRGKAVDLEAHSLTTGGCS
jgi:hypothetical protein